MLEDLRVEERRGAARPRRRRLARSYDLSVHSDGCGVIRSTRRRDPHGLQWWITDRDGFQVLGRNALGEDRYRFFQPGTYDVVLKAWDGRAYAPVSNTVTIRCP